MNQRLIANGCSLQTPYIGFNLTEAYELAYPCYLHTIQLGLAGHLISLSEHNNALASCLIQHCGGDLDYKKHAAGRRLLTLVNCEIAAVPAFPGMCLPTDGICAGMITAEANDNLLAALPVALLAIAKEVEGIEELICSIVGERALRSIGNTISGNCHGTCRRCALPLTERLCLPCGLAAITSFLACCALSSFVMTHWRCQYNAMQSC